MGESIMVLGLVIAFALVATVAHVTYSRTIHRQAQDHRQLISALFDRHTAERNALLTFTGALLERSDARQDSLERKLMVFAEIRPKVTASAQLVVDEMRAEMLRAKLDIEKERLTAVPPPPDDRPVSIEEFLEAQERQQAKERRAAGEREDGFEAGVR